MAASHLVHMKIDISRIRWPKLLRWPSFGSGQDDANRDVALRILLAVVWLPIQIILSLLFATGGLFLLLILGILLAPLAGLGFGIWYLARRPSSQG